MGIETAIIMGASVAISAASAASSMSAAGEQRKLQGQSAAEQVRAADASRQQNEVEKQVSQGEVALQRAAAADGLVAANLSTVATSLAGQDLAVQTAVQRNGASRLTAEAETIGASVRLANQGQAIQDAQVRRRLVDNTAEIAAKAAQSLSTARVVAAEAGLSGTSLNALIQEAAFTEGGAANRVVAEGRDQLEGLQIERNKVRLQAMSSMLDLSGRVDAAGAALAKSGTDQGRLQLQGQQDEINVRRAISDQGKVELNAARAAAGVTTRDIQIDSQIKQTQIADRVAQVQYSQGQAQAIFGVMQSGLQIASGAYNQSVLRGAQLQSTKANIRRAEGI